MDTAEKDSTTLEMRRNLGRIMRVKLPRGSEINNSKQYKVFYLSE